LPLSLKMVRTVGAAVDLLLDTYSGAAAAYSVRKLDKDYTGYAMRVREDSGDTEADIGFDSNGDLNTAAIATHCGSANGYVVTWYDQSGNSNNATQSTAASQPQIYNGTAVTTENSKPAVSFDGSNDYLSLTSTASTNSVCQILVSVYDISTSTIKMPLGGGSGVPWWQHYSLNRMRILPTSGSLIFSTGLSAGTQFLGFMNGNSGAYTFHLNGASKISTTAGNWYIDQIGRGLNSATYSFDNVIQEVILYESDQSSNRTGIETNINTYFSIYT